jgi:hypothetical protein
MMFETRIITHLLTLLLFSTTVYAQIIPSNRVTTWQPGVTNNGGIPIRTTVYKTLSPSGGDDTAAIQAALNGCPPNQVVQLTAGVFRITGNGLGFASPNCTLRGVGPGKGLSTGINAVESFGTFIADPTATQLIKADRASNPSWAILYVGRDPTQFSASINLASDAAQGANSLALVSNPGIQVGEIVLVDQNTDTDPDVVWGPVHDPPGGGSRRWFVRQDRSLNQMMEVTAVNGNTITFATPFHITFKTAYAAQLSRYAQPVPHGMGVENIFFFGGMGGDWHGNVSMNLCAYCWIKNIEAFWSLGTSVGLYGSYRSELRDSYIHETPSPDPGGGGYMVGLNYGASDNLVENNIMWYGNKEIVMRGTGGGNVIAYNYMDDAFGSTYPNTPEAGANAGHYTTPHMELLEGNYSQNYKGDSYWGNSIYITVFRNHLSGLRAGASPLGTYATNPSQTGGCSYPYGDFEGRGAVDVQAYSYNTNFVGNVLGFSGQTLLRYSSGCYSPTQTRFVYENLDNSITDNAVIMWNMGAYQATQNTSCGCWSWDSTTYQTQLRQGNWDWATKTQSWDGIGGTGSPGSGTPQTIPNSLYLTSKPAFFGSNPWPWVDPSTGLVSTLPAKARFAQIRSGNTPVNNNTHDFDGDGKSDILWQDTSGSGSVDIFLMNGPQILQNAGVANVLSPWSIVGQRDFDGDGKSDILWRDTSVGTVAIWFMNGTQLTQSVGVANVATAWKIVGTGDFNGDGKGDILWQDTSGNVAIWLMNGAQLMQNAGIANVSGWSIAGTGDFNGDGKTDILWSNSSGTVAIWFMNGTQLTQSVGVANAPSGWTIVGIGDFNGDGKSDILWQDGSGNVAIWLMNGAQLIQSVGVGNASGWSIIETGDFNGDGTSDILWRNSSGTVAIWLMNNAQITQSVGVANVPTNWSVQSANAD